MHRRYPEIAIQICRSGKATVTVPQERVPINHCLLSTQALTQGSLSKGHVASRRELFGNPKSLCQYIPAQLPSMKDGQYAVRYTQLLYYGMGHLRISFRICAKARSHRATTLLLGTATPLLAQVKVAISVVLKYDFDTS